MQTGIIVGLGIIALILVELGLNSEQKYVKMFFISSGFGFSIIMVNLLHQLSIDNANSSQVIAILSIAYTTLLTVFICFISYVMISFLYDAVILLKEQMSDRENGRGKF